MIFMTLVIDEIEDLRDVQNRIYTIRQEVHNYLSPPESNREFDRLSKVLVHISAAVDLLTGKTKWK